MVGGGGVSGVTFCGWGLAWLYGFLALRLPGFMAQDSVAHPTIPVRP